MEKQQFLNKFEELKSPANAQRWAVLRLWLVEAKSDGEIAKVLDKDRSTATRKIGEICKHFGIDTKGKKEQRQHLVLLFRRYCKDFEVHPSIYPDWVDGNSGDRPQPSTNSQNIPTRESIPEQTTLEFIGRDRDLTNLANLSRQAKIVLIKAGAGVGKSTLAREFLQTQFKKVIRLEMGLESGNLTPAEEKVSQILRKDFDEEPSRDFMINLDILGEKLADRANPIGVLIDNLEPALDENYRFREKLRGYDALLAVLGDRDVFSFTLITSRRSLITPRAKVNEYSLEGLDITAWRQYFHDCENGADSDALMQMCVAYNGNAKVMDILHGAIKNRFDGNIGAYWNRYKDALLADSELETLISVEMDWLRDNQPDAYKLLCRMGCYRYQDVKTVPFEGLICLLWDVPESQRVCIVDHLSKSCLIEVKGEYYLHPAIREAAKSRLLDNKTDWRNSNQKIAEFWTNSVNTVETTNDALQAFESYYHHINIEDFEEAAIVIIRRRVNKWSEIVPNRQSYGEILGRSLYRFGLMQFMISKITSIINNINYGYSKAQLYNILGDLYWVTGSLHKAIENHHQSGEISRHFINLLKNDNIPINDIYINFVMVQSSYFLNMGICSIDLGEINEAKYYWEELKIFTESDTFSDLYNADKICAYFCLAFVNSCLGLKKDALYFINKTNELSSYRVSPWVEGYRFLFLAQSYTNIGELERSFEVFQQAIKFAEESYYYQVKAKSFVGLAEIFRIKQDFAKAIANHVESIDLLNKIGAKCDLAEAYFQLGLTYQAMGEHDQAEEYKAKALELFEQMEAPKQIERVNKAFGGNIQ
jgi:tetratricopeptide (TPR) repeat protein